MREIHFLSYSLGLFLDALDFLDFFMHALDHKIDKFRVQQVSERILLESLLIQVSEGIFLHVTHESLTEAENLEFVHGLNGVGLLFTVLFQQLLFLV